MDEMVERVAYQIGMSLYGDCTPEETPLAWANLKAAAREAIAAMRDPTKAMIEAAARTRPGAPPNAAARLGLGLIYSAMIDAALRGA